MRVRLLLCLASVGVGVPALCLGETCGPKYTYAFSSLPSAGPRTQGPAQASAEVQGLFGPRPDHCEAGGYQRFVEAYRDFAREAMRAPARGGRDGLLWLAIAAAERGPLRVPAEEGRAAVTIYRQVRSDLHAIADDVGLNKTPLLQQLLDVFDRMGPPQAMPPVAAPAPPPGSLVQTVRVPTTPLPTWAVVALYEIREALAQKNPALAQSKIEAILKWVDAAP